MASLQYASAPMELAYSSVSTAPPTMIFTPGARSCSCLMVSSMLGTVVVISALSPTSGTCSRMAVSTTVSGGRGFTAIIVAWLAKMNPFVMILISALLSFLDKGAVQIASDFGLNEYVSKIISGVILFFILGSEFFINYQVKTGAKHK